MRPIQIHPVSFALGVLLAAGTLLVAGFATRTSPSDEQKIDISGDVSISHSFHNERFQSVPQPFKIKME